MRIMNLFESLRLYAVTDENGDQVEKVRQALAGGATFIQYRAKGGCDFDTAVKMRDLCRAYHVPFVLDDDVEMAKACGADGVHVGQSDASAVEARRILGEDAIVGVSAGNLTEVLKAVADGADYIGTGAMFPTTTKMDAEYVEYNTLKTICTSVPVPVVAIGGIGEHNIAKLAGSGIAGVAVVSAVFSQPDIVKAARILDKLTKETDFRAEAKRAFILDFDGTMYDSMSIWAHLADDFLISCGKVPRPDLSEKLKDWGLRDGIIYLRDAYGIACSREEAVQRFSDLLTTAYQACQLKPGVFAMADYLKSHGLLSCIATAGDQSAVKMILKRENLTDSFGPVFSSTTLETDKTSPEFFYRVLEKLGASLNGSVMFDDAPFALRAGYRAGLKCVRILDSAWTDSGEVEADETVSTLEEWLNHHKD